MKSDRKIEIMGIVNMTDDSYFADSRCSGTGAALKRIGQMVGDGADIIDIGACSSRPGSVPVGADEEWRRLELLLKEIRTEFPDVRISIDTYWSSVVGKAYDIIGHFMVNDISAGEDDPVMLQTVARLGLEYVAMHKHGTPVAGYFSDFAVRAREAGVHGWILDPGFGFSKAVEQNYSLLQGLKGLRSAFPEHKILVGVSRKSMIYKPLGISPEEALPATQAVHMAALLGGADILRVHDVKEAKQTALLYEMLQSVQV